MYNLPASLSAIVEMTLNRYVGLDPAVSPEIAELSGKVIAIELRDLQLQFYLLPADDRILVQGDYEGDVDARLRGTSIGMARMSLGNNVSESLFSGDVEISGDVELGEQFRQLMDDMDIDWEEQLSKVTGDVIAHQAGNTLRGLMAWGKNTSDILGQDISEYLHEEDRSLPTREDVDDFIRSVDEMRSDVDRAEAKVQRLAQRLSEWASRPKK